MSATITPSAAKPVPPAPTTMPVGAAKRDTPARRDSIFWLREVSRADTARVGGKGANLGEMARAGLPVPPAFIISIDAYARFRESSAIGAQLEAQLRHIRVDDPAALQRASDSLRDLVEKGGLPGDLEEEITAAYAQLCLEQRIDQVAVAVRSSATARDAAPFSVAGLFESFLNVQGLAELIRRVKSCWASTFHARGLSSRLKQGMPAEMPVAVVVQVMVNADKAGVVFAVDPATRDPNRMVIEAAWGLGEVVVLGQITPDRYVLSKDTLAVLEEYISTKSFMLARDPGGSGVTARIQLAGDVRRKKRVLSVAELQELGELTRRVEQHYGAPRDIEFAFDSRMVYVTQSRPAMTESTSVNPDGEKT